MYAGESSAFTSGFLSNPTAQLETVERLASLRQSQIPLRTEVLERAHQRRELIETLIDDEVGRQGRNRRPMGWTAAGNRARARPEVGKFDQETRRLKEQIEQIEIEVERYRSAMQVAAKADTTATRSTTDEPSI